MYGLGPERSGLTLVRKFPWFRKMGRTIGRGRVVLVMGRSVQSRTLSRADARFLRPLMGGEGGKRSTENCRCQGRMFGKNLQR